MTMKQLMHGFIEENGEILSTITIRNVVEPSAQTLKEDEILIKIIAQLVNPLDISMTNPFGGSKDYKQGENSVYQEILPFAASKYKLAVGNFSRFGSEACGQVVATGSKAVEL
eukprot:snap_masked-scaffold_12-processed-gene-0.18-mRNA-1 protein AED:1.00 eAED:1.00 QI:0/-1/0/0/-1/1/1/0/112